MEKNSISQVIKHLGSGNLYDASPHDLTALMLLIYFKRDLSVEDVSEFMDVETLMTVLSQHLRNGKMSRSEPQITKQVIEYYQLTSGMR